MGGGLAKARGWLTPATFGTRLLLLVGCAEAGWRPFSGLGGRRPWGSSILNPVIPIRKMAAHPKAAAKFGEEGTQLGSM
jgi:hypothetical protein